MEKRTYYHVSPQANRASIEQHGLSASRCIQSPWGNPDDWDEGQYLWDDRDVAQDYADELVLDASDIWEVDASGIEIVSDPSITPGTPEYGSRWHPHAFFTSAPIPAQCLRRVGADWDSMQSQALAGAI